MPRKVSSESDVKYNSSLVPIMATEVQVKLADHANFLDADVSQKDYSRYLFLSLLSYEASGCNNI